MYYALILVFRKIPPLAALIGGGMFLFISVSEILARAEIEVSGTILHVSTECQQPYNNRCVTTYVIGSTQENSKVRYSAGPTDASLRQYLSPGTVIHKSKWSIDYSIDGSLVQDFPLYFYIPIALIGVFLFIPGLVFSIKTLSQDGLVALFGLR